MNVAFCNYPHLYTVQHISDLAHMFSTHGKLIIGLHHTEINIVLNKNQTDATTFYHFP